MTFRPNELPEGGGPGESQRMQFPQAPRGTTVQPAAVVAVLNELVNVRARLHRLENARLFDTALGGAARPTARPFHPNELPEGGEGGEFVPIPGEILPNELPEGGEGGEFVPTPGEILPGENPAELPVVRGQIDRLDARLAALETSIVTRLTALEEQLNRITEAGGG
jgi:hypothetical protein